ncbi:uncharacterized protein METZ01_LOCUS155423 [marine metagenome]|uniref:Uncharacterized protein n=1 Tax=marine metagenome TaxID=408172 RepID=A0A382AMF6_9ZZZZ
MGTGRVTGLAKEGRSVDIDPTGPRGIKFVTIYVPPCGTVHEYGRTVCSDCLVNVLAYRHVEVSSRQGDHPSIGGGPEDRPA